MNFKVKIIAAAACAVTVCMAGLSGCATAQTGLMLDSYWYVSDFESIQPSAVNPEELVYELKFTEAASPNDKYKVNYFTDSENFTEGEDAHYFRTTFYATDFDWSDASVDESYRLTQADVDNLPDGDALKARLDGTKEKVYALKTELKVSGEYIFGQEQSGVKFTDSLVTETYFRSSKNGLQPVYSMQDVTSTVPKSLYPDSKEEMCEQLDYTYTVSYNSTCTGAKITYTPASGNSQVTNLQFDGTPGTLFDNNSLYTVIRGLSLSDGYSTALNLLSPADGGFKAVSVSCAGEGELDAEADADIIAALTAAYGQPETEESEEESEEQHSNIFYNPVTISSADGRGVARLAWYAEVENERDNTYRATMLRLVQPLSYNLGSWEFRLADVVKVLGRA